MYSCKLMNEHEMYSITMSSLDKLRSDQSEHWITDGEYLDLVNAYEVVMMLHECCQAAGMVGAGWRYENRDYQWLLIVDKDGSCYESLISSDPLKILRAFAEVFNREF